LKKQPSRSDKKHRALKTGKIEEGIATKSYFKPIIEPQKIVDNSSMGMIKDEPRDVTSERRLSRRTRVR